MFIIASEYTTGVLYSSPLQCRVFSLMVGVVIAPNRSLSARISSIRSPRVTDTSSVFCLIFVVWTLQYRVQSIRLARIWAWRTKSFLSTFFVHRFLARLSSCAAPDKFGEKKFFFLSVAFLFPVDVLLDMPCLADTNGFAKSISCRSWLANLLGSASERNDVDQEGEAKCPSFHGSSF